MTSTPTSTCFFCGGAADAGSRLEIGASTYALCKDDTVILTQHADLIWQWVRARMGLKRVHRDGECPCGAKVSPDDANAARLRIGNLHVTLCAREAVLVKKSLQRLGGFARAVGLRGLITMGKTMFGGTAG